MPKQDTDSKHKPGSQPSGPQVDEERLARQVPPPDEADESRESPPRKEEKEE